MTKINITEYTKQMKQTLHVSVLGAGRWGSLLAWYNHKIGNKTISWNQENDPHFIEFVKTRKNEYLTMPQEVEFTSNLQKALESDYIFISISSQALRSFLSTVTTYNISNKTFILCMKGIENETGKRLTQVAQECGIPKENLAILAGPGHVQDLVAGKPNCMVVSAYNEKLAYFLAEQLTSPLLKFYVNTDILGCENGAAAKNVLGIAAGALDGLHMASLKGPLMTLGAKEVATYIEKEGGNYITAFGLAHLGDFETTLFSEFSQNRLYGEALAKNKPYNKLAEGVMTTKAMYQQAQKHHIHLPIIEGIYKCLFEHATIQETIQQLMRTPLKNE